MSGLYCQQLNCYYLFIIMLKWLIFIWITSSVFAACQYHAYFSMLRALCLGRWRCGFVRMFKPLDIRDVSDALKLFVITHITCCVALMLFKATQSVKASLTPSPLRGLDCLLTSERLNCIF